MNVTWSKKHITTGGIVVLTAMYNSVNADRRKMCMNEEKTLRMSVCVSVVLWRHGYELRKGEGKTNCRH